MSDLFSAHADPEQPDFRPLAARLRPTNLDEYVGQQHILGDNKPLKKAIEKGHCHSMILWGPPGTGKTTLAEIIASHCNAHIERISAVTSGVKDIRQAIETAKAYAAQQTKRTLLFVDEVHRFNKSQQDAFLPFIEDGTVTFIGATTENPSFELNSALLSRARVYVLRALQTEDLLALLQRAKQHLCCDIQSDAEALLIEVSAGDARRLLNLLELAADMTDAEIISSELIKQVSGEKVAQYDKGGDHFYDLISAFHKSVRGSSSDGALYWMARMLVAGCDPLYIARRLLAIATEDIGNADPRAMQVCLNAWDIFHRVGAAEGERAIAQATIYCACAPKSNAVYKAFKQAIQDAKSLPDYPVPVHLRNAPTRLLKELGHGEEYRYAHDEAHAFAAGESYLPELMQTPGYYQPKDRGMEKQIAEKLRFLAQLDSQAVKKRYQ